MNVNERMLCQIRPSVCPSHSGIVSKRVRVFSYDKQSKCRNVKRWPTACFMATVTCWLTGRGRDKLLFHAHIEHISIFTKKGIAFPRSAGGPHRQCARPAGPWPPAASKRVSGQSGRWPLDRRMRYEYISHATCGRARTTHARWLSVIMHTRAPPPPLSVLQSCGFVVGQTTTNSEGYNHD